MTEATTAITDLVLGGLTLVFAIYLVAMRPVVRARRWWAAALAAAGTAALAGAFYHAFLGQIAPGALATVWKVTLLSICVAAFALVPATAFAFLPAKTTRICLGVAGVVSVGFAVVALTRDDFLIAVLNYGCAIVFVGVVVLSRHRLHPVAAGWILAGLALSVAAAIVQQSGFALHPRFNHNDLYHVIQIVANSTLFEGARRIGDYRDPSAR